MRKRLFLSCASCEFLHVREQLAADCRFPDVDVKSHEEVSNFIGGDTTLEKLDNYILECDAVIHLLGQAVGTQAEQAGIDALQRRYPNLREHLPEVGPLLVSGAPWRGSYTQWEAYLALYHRKPCFVFVATEQFERPTGFEFFADETELQAGHRERLERREQDRREFNSREELRVQVQRSLRKILPGGASLFQADISRILKYAPGQLIGREAELKLLNDAWAKVTRTEKGRPHILTFVALGGEGKTSLIAKWAVELAAQDWPGCDGAFAWSFYSQGTRDQVAASSDLFLKEALNFFANGQSEEEEIKAFAASSAGAFEKGQRLAHIVGQRRSLLILDGLEPLQYAPTSPAPGELKDQGMAALLKGLAANKTNGLCVVTTRYSITGLKAFWRSTVQEEKLLRLSKEAGVALLKNLGVKGVQKEFEKLVENVKGHALTLNILGTYLRDAYAGEIRKSSLIKLEEADAEEQGGHAFHVMDAYARSLESEGEKGKRALAILRLMGLFDRPATADCLNALWTGDPISNLTEPLVGMAEAQRNIILRRLEDAKLLTANWTENTGELFALDAHPLLREYFARQLRTQYLDAWRAAHGRLYEHLCANTKEGDDPTLEDLQPLYQAVAHGCSAGAHQGACDDVYSDRLLRGEEQYSWKQLGAVGSDLAVMQCFFEVPWGRLARTLSESTQDWLFHQTSMYLRGVGRLVEAVEPVTKSLENNVARESWDDAAVCGIGLTELLMALGKLRDSLRAAERALEIAKSGFRLAMLFTTTARVADALNQLGNSDLAAKRFWEAELHQNRQRGAFPILYGQSGFQYCDLMLADSERYAWRICIEWNSVAKSPGLVGTIRQQLSEVTDRATRTLAFAKENHFSLFSFGLDYLTRDRSRLYGAIVDGSIFQNPGMALEQLGDPGESAVETLRNSQRLDELPRALLTRAWLRFLKSARIGPESAQEDLDEAWEIAERGPMRLYMADIHLYRARLFFREQEYPWREGKNLNGEFVTKRTAADDLAAAEKLINECGYHRRDDELADAKKAIL